MELSGKNALITGASRGIGKTIALTLAKNGVNVAINFLKNKELAESVAKKARAYGVKAEIYKADVSIFEEVTSMIERIISDFGSIEILINNAGIIPKNYSVTDIPIQEWQKIISVNLTGSFNVIKAVVPYMIKQKEGKIVNMASVAGKMGGTVGPHYAASKAGIIGMTFSLAQELLKYNITVNAIAPGPIETEMIANLPQDVKMKILKRVPMGRFGKPEEVAEAVLFLIKCDFVTGEVIDVNGGYYMD
ncbi:MAG: 3-oxoacyl-ACP reductase family protein [Candidatus Njordarchaeia archaeon]|nr:3-oxoacyl-ACP reductase FabG [Candidatus Korarchaeota archaeon]